MLRARTSDVESTRSLAAAIAAVAASGDLILLAGELGAGKTAFVQGFGAGLGVDGAITSPTFTLAHQYEGRLPMHHLDVYRLERFAEMDDIGVSELLDGGGVVLIEWGDAVAPALPKDYLEITLTYGEGDDERQLELRCVGSRWTARERVLAEQLEPWKAA
ncbi:MAG TPA: tRNA (adenosine(37)-N6)-threonylcarbamoyltransferase complex ATPase subunit type 1 TsaE [Acidimicrobiales bacterium]|nr:tRNA (adenosine(37)-N6)-threonylcarbamoyltransferase complex ATPase subunit type 1 TsaE [Acidimicrobiales bacterium]